MSVEQVRSVVTNVAIEDHQAADDSIHMLTVIGLVIVNEIVIDKYNSNSSSNSN